MQCVDDPSITEFAGRVLPWLERDPVVDNLIYTVIAAHAAEEPRDADRWMRVLDGTELVGVATMTPPRNALLSTMRENAAVALPDPLAQAAHLARAAVPGVTGRAAAADAFAKRYSALTGRDLTIGL